MNIFNCFKSITHIYKIYKKGTRKYRVQIYTLSIKVAKIVLYKNKTLHKSRYFIYCGKNIYRNREQ